MSSPPNAVADEASADGPIVVVGAGGFGREVFDIIDALSVHRRVARPANVLHPTER